MMTCKNVGRLQNYRHFAAHTNKNTKNLTLTATSLATALHFKHASWLHLHYHSLHYNPSGNLNSGCSSGEQSSLEVAVPTSSRRHCIAKPAHLDIGLSITCFIKMDLIFFPNAFEYILE